MTYCSQCGAALPARARFCPGCGQPVAGSPGADTPPAPPEAPPARSAAPTAAEAAPAWLTSDWLVAVVAAGLLLGACLAVGLVYGALLAVAETGDGGAILPGLVTGAYLPFVMFGVETFAQADGEPVVRLGARYLPLLLLAVPVAATWAALRFALPRVPREPSAVVALVVKIALVVCVVAAVMAGLLSIGDEGGAGSDGFVAEVSAGAAAIYPFLIIVPAGLAFLWRTGIRPEEERVRRVTGNLWASSAAWGAAAFVAFAAGMGVLALLADVIVADDGRARFTQVLRTPLDGLNEGVAGAVVAMGGAVARMGSHTSLLHWGSYEIPGDENAPAPLFLLLLVASAVVGYVTYRRLERERPTAGSQVPEQQVLQVATGVAAGFVVTAWILSLLGRITRLSVDPVVEPSPRGAFGLGLVWAALGATAAALVWSRQRGLRWTLPPADPGAGATTTTAVGPPPVVPPPLPPPPPVPPVEAAPETVEITDESAAGVGRRTLRRRGACASCGAALAPRAALCPECGTPAPPLARRAPPNPPG
jgi:RNA polymerase subunit RPABC4/transcription elongation factor Spt4